MAGIVAYQVNSSLKALLLEDVELAKQIIEQDRKVDKLDNKIDKLYQRIFALTQPVATDLRFIMSSLKINNDLERMGDHAVGIAYKIETLTENREVTCRRQPQCGIYLFFTLLSIHICRFGDCQPPETARIARLPVR